MESDLNSIDSALRPWRPLLRYVFRVEIDGLENIPADPCLFVSNHNAGAMFEIMALLDAWHARFSKREVYGLAHPFAFKIGFAGYLRGIGAVPATYKDAYEVLEKGASLIIFPGGNWETCRPFSQRWISDFGNHYGWARIALQARRRVVPISISGSHTLNPMLLRSRRLASLMVIPRLLGVKYFPVSVSQLFWASAIIICGFHFLPWWLLTPLAYAAFLFTPLVPIWPGKIRIRLGHPLDLLSLTSDSDTEGERLEIAYARVSAEVQAGMNALRAL